VSSVTPREPREPFTTPTEGELSISGRALQDHLRRTVRTWLGLSAHSDAEIPSLPAWLARLLLRVEEYGPPNGPTRQDEFGLWEFPYSSNFHRGRLWIPEVDRWVNKRRRELARAVELEPLWPNGYRFAVCLTHDVDMVSRQVSPRQALRAIRTAVSYPAGRRTRASKGATAAARSLYFGISRAPSTRTIEQCLEVERAFAVKSSYFFTVGPTHPDDCIYALDDPCRFQRKRGPVAAVIRSIANEGFDVGLHGSFLSASTQGLLSEEKAALECVLDRPVQTIRQHYLNFDPRITPRLQDAAGLRADCSLGFNRNLGFRAGTSLPFRMFDFERERPFRILEMPLIIQEAALLRHDSLQLDVGLSKHVMRQLYAEIEEVGGLVTVLFHPHSLLDPRYLELYRFVIEHSLARKAWVTSLAAVTDWWHARESRLDRAPREDDVSS
jgi:hypothetical protein